MNRGIQDTVALLAGVGVGSALMYLLDPQSGQTRRRVLSETARDTFDDASETFGDISQNVAQRARGAMSQLGEGMSDASESIGASTGRLTSALARGARQYLPRDWRFRRRQSSWGTAGQAAGVTVGGVALIALGAGVAYLFDPDRGWARRAQLGERLSLLTRDTAALARRTGRHLARQLSVPERQPEQLSDAANAV